MVPAATDCLAPIHLPVGQNFQCLRLGWNALGIDDVQQSFDDGGHSDREEIKPLQSRKHGKQ